MKQEQMAAKIRAFELKCQQHMAEFRCPVHLCLGQENIAAALHCVMRKDDWLFSTHRNHGHYLAKGGDEDKLWNELMGREDGVNAGWAGSQCYSDPAINFHSSAIVGGLIGAAVGTALSMKLRKQRNVVMCCIGDGATEQGVFWESLNFASLWELPVIFVCENNGYSVHADVRSRQGEHTSIVKRAMSFGVAGLLRDSSTIEPEGLKIMRNSAMSGNPVFVEVFCDRECNHVGNMPDFRVGDKA
jgi:TPP-dependent pyruvate/acetoin dehydrogenase alpha subunit